MGMSRSRRSCSGIELPLALPLIFAGIRIAAVFIIATATIAAVAGGGGLGDVIVNQASTSFPASSAHRSSCRCSPSASPDPRARRGSF